MKINSYPTVKEITKCKKAIQRKWPMMSKFLNDFFTESYIAHGKIKGDPFTKKAWIDRKNGYSFKMTMSDNPIINIFININPCARNK